jgi:hypothetical protein
VLPCIFFLAGIELINLYLYSFIQAIEQIFFLFFYVGLAWAWVVLAGLCVNRARTGNFSQSRLQANQEKYAYLQQTDPTMYSRRIVFEGSYIEAGPAIICSAFLGVGTAFYVCQSNGSTSSSIKAYRLISHRLG